jgi:hypothetical protein
MHWARLNVRIRSKQATTLQLRRPMRRILSTCCARAATDQVTAPPRNVINSRRLIAAPDGTLKGHAAYQPAPVVWKGFRSAACPLWVTSGHMRCSSLCPLYPPTATAKADMPQMVMSALHLKADMCGALSHVCFGPKADITWSLDHFVGVGEHGRRHGEAQRLRGLEIDRQFVLGRRLHW